MCNMGYSRLVLSVLMLEKQGDPLGIRDLASHNHDWILFVGRPAFPLADIPSGGTGIARVV
jgi:hypothetical protein